MGKICYSTHDVMVLSLNSSPFHDCDRDKIVVVGQKKWFLTTQGSNKDGIY